MRRSRRAPTPARVRRTPPRPEPRLPASTEPVTPTAAGETARAAAGTVGETVEGATRSGATGTVGRDGRRRRPAPSATRPTRCVGGVGSFLDGGSLLSANINVDADANLTAPVAGAVAANANIAAPVDAAVAANIASPGAVAQAAAVQNLQITQTLEDVEANATADQDADVDQ